MLEVFYHFLGMSIMGALLIRGSAFWARHHYIKEIKKDLDHSEDTKAE